MEEADALNTRDVRFLPSLSLCTRKALLCRRQSLLTIEWLVIVVSETQSSVERRGEATATNVPSSACWRRHVAGKLLVGGCRERAAGLTWRSEHASYAWSRGSRPRPHAGCTSRGEPAGREASSSIVFRPSSPRSTWSTCSRHLLTLSASVSRGSTARDFWRPTGSARVVAYNSKVKNADEDILESYATLPPHVNAYYSVPMSGRGPFWSTSR